MCSRISICADLFWLQNFLCKIENSFQSVILVGVWIVWVAWEVGSLGGSHPAMNQRSSQATTTLIWVNYGMWRTLKGETTIG